MAEDKAGIIPVATWPKTISTSAKLICNPTMDQCVKVGYRLLTAKPTTPSGKQIKTETIIQDPNDETKCKYEVTYEDIPIVGEPVIIPEVLTNVPASKVSFNFTSNGFFRGVTWLDAPKTNAVGKE